MHHYSTIPQGKSILFNYFRKALPHEVAEGSSYVLVDIYDNLWSAPEVFLKWCQAVDSGMMKEPEKSTYHFCITHVGDEYRLYYSLKRDSLQVVHHPVPPPYSPFPKAGSNEDSEEEEEEDPFPADEEDECEKKDPDFIPK